MPFKFDNNINECLILGKTLVKNTLVVAMHRSDVEQQETVFSSTVAPEGDLYSLRLTNIYYADNRTLKCLENENAKRDIELFMTEYLLSITKLTK